MKKIYKWFKLEEGFTLIEMSLVLFIISALLLLFVPNIAGRQESANETSDEAVITVLQSQVDMYKMDNKGNAPDSFNTMKTAGYLTEKQLSNTTGKYTINAGVVTKTGSTSQ